MYLAGKVLLTLYLYFISYFYTLSVPLSWTSPVRLVLIYLAVNFVCEKVQCIKVPVLEERKNKNYKFGAGVFAGTFLFMLLYYLAYYPGGLCSDTFNQWYQVDKGFLLDWHPAIHTFLFLQLPSLLYNSLAFANFMQIVWLGGAVAYLGMVMERWGIKKRWICIALAVGLANPASAVTLSFTWKDTALTIFLVALSGQLIEIVFSEGRWLSVWYHGLTFGLFAALAALMRHNAILLVAPMLLLVAVIYWKKIKYYSVFAGMWVLLFMAGIKGPLYRVLAVQNHPQVSAEMLGVPMTILANVLVKSPESLDEEAREFLYRIGPQELWENTYQEGNWNSAKWMGDDISNDVIEEEGASNVLRYTWHAIQKEPYDSYRAVVKLFDVVWKPLGTEVIWGYRVEVSSNIYGYESKGILWMQRILDFFRDLSLNGTIWTTWGWHIGFFVLLLLIAGVSRLKEGLEKSLLWVPILCYDFGTAFVLCGHDFRFFSFNTLLVLPLLLVMAGSKNQPQNDLGEHSGTD